MGSEPVAGGASRAAVFGRVKRLEIYGRRFSSKEKRQKHRLSPLLFLRSFVAFANEKKGGDKFM